MAFIKVEVQENEGFNTLILTPRDNDDETRKQMDLIFHAIMSAQPKRGGAVPGTSVMKVDVKTEDLLKELNVKL